MSWLEAAAPYLPVIHAAEDRYALPTNLLARVGFQESSYRLEVIDGTVKSSAGAVGMFQLLPRFFPGAGVSWERDANTAAGLLADLYARFKDWQLAIAAYNWGQGDVRHEIVADGGHPKLADMPTETQNYVREVFADVPVAGALISTA